jgi:hypothetical protein
MTAHLIARAEVPSVDDRAEFDRWYEEEHLPQAAAAFQPIRAWRGWSTVDPTVHYAFYEYPDLSRVQEVLGSDALKGLIAEFDRVWGTRARRVREVVACAQMLSGSSTDPRVG